MALWFYSKSPEHAWLSNLAESSFVLDGMRWPSVEHYYQAQKYAGTTWEKEIRAAATPHKARKMGQNRSLTVRSDWPEVKQAIMRHALEAKFAQNRELRERLLGTGEEELIHQSSSDLYWGRSLNGEGENQLGIMLMEVRTTLRAKAPRP